MFRSIFNPLRSASARSGGTRHPRRNRGTLATARRPRRKALRLEPLEGRQLLSVLSVWTARNPLGSLAYESSGSGQVDVGAPTDVSQVNLDAGQTLTAIVTPNPGPLQPSISITGPDGLLLSSATATSAGQAVLVQSVPVDVSGSYSCEVSAANGAAGGFQIRLVLNATAEEEGLVAPENSDPASAQDLQGQLFALGDSARRAVVVGSLPGNTGASLRTESFEQGIPASGWSTYSSTAYGRIQATAEYGASDGSTAMVMDCSPQRKNNNLNEAVWTVDLSQQAQAVLTFDHASWNDAVTGFSGSFADHYNADGIAIRNGSGQWYPTWTPPSQAAGVWQSYTIDLAAAAAQNGISLGSQFQIKFQQYGNAPVPNGGRGWDDLAILVPEADKAVNQDWYSFTLAEGELATVTATRKSTGAVHLQLYDASGKLSDGDPAPTNVDEAIRFTAPAPGTYYARVSGNDFYSTNGTDYVLTVMAGMTFDLEDNSGPQAGDASQTLAFAASDFGVAAMAQGAIGPGTPVNVVAPRTGGLDAATGVAIGPDGYLYVGSWLTDQVLRFDRTTGAFMDVFVSTGSGGLVDPGMLRFGPDGNLYVSGVSSGRVYRYHGTTGDFLDVFTSGGNLSIPENFQWGPDGKFYLADRGTNRVLRYDGATGQFIDAFVTSGLNGPLGVTFGPDGNLYVGNHLANTILRYDGATGALLGTFVTAGSGGLRNPHQIIFGDDGYLYVCSADTDQILRYHGTTGAFVDAFTGGAPLDRPVNMVFDPDGRLLVGASESDNVVLALGPSDFYKLTLSPGDVLTAETLTPFGGPLSPDNKLDPVLRLYDASGNPVASDDNGAADVRNARLCFQATAPGDYYIEVNAAAGTKGQYLLKAKVYQDTSPVLVVDNMALLEGDAGTATARFTVRLLNPSPGIVTVNYATQDGTALASSDYTATVGTLSFAGEAEQVIEVPVIADTDEAEEYFFIQLSNPQGAAIGFDQARATILNDDTTLSVSDVTVVEGDTGTLNATFQVTLSSPTAEMVTVGYQTANDTATAPADYLATSGTLTFLPGETTKAINVAVPGDTAPETGSKTFFVNLTTTNVDAADNQAVGTIVDNDYAGVPPINYASFNSTSGLALVGSTKRSGSRLRLTPAQAGKAGAAWYTTQMDVAGGFKTTFQFLMPGGSDGLAFVVQNAPQGTAAIGGAGGSMGYAGIVNSLAVEFDAYSNGGGAGEPNGNHVAVHTNGTGANSAEAAYALGAAIPGFTLDNNVVHTATIDYAGGFLRVFLDGAAQPTLSVPVDLATTLSLIDGKAYVGFTGATGGAAFQTHDVLTWQYAPLPAGSQQAAAAESALAATDALLGAPSPTAPDALVDAFWASTAPKSRSRAAVDSLMATSAEDLLARGVM